LVRPISPIQDIAGIFELKKIIKELQPDIIHLNSTKASIIGSLASLFIYVIRHKLVYTVHGWAFNESLNPIKKKIYLLAEKLTARTKDLIICVSEFDRQAGINKKVTKEDKLITITNGVEANKTDFLSKEEAKKELTIPKDRIIIGTIANFYSTKGLEYFIGALNTLAIKWRLPVTGVIIGDGKLKGKLKNLKNNYGLGDHLIFTGIKDNAVKYLKAYDIYVCSSVKEGFPYSILEAMSAKLPIVSTDVGGIPEIIENEKNGILTGPKNSLGLAKNIKILMDNKEYGDKLATEANQRVKEEFSKKQMIEKTYSNY
jgi:glycosyltransferase involved in cell wall biosynthesis